MKTRSVITFLMMTFNSFAFELISHRGVHQTYHRKNLTNTTCTAIRIDKTGHHYLENTLESIERAFNLGAHTVELDVHPTSEKDGKPDELIVFHDWTLNCRTEATCEHGCKCNSQNECLTHEQSLSYLSNLDLGHGYTYDSGQSYPFRGAFIGKMPTFQDVLELLKKYPSKQLLVNVKGNEKRTTLAFMRILNHYSENLRSQLYYPYFKDYKDDLNKLRVKDAIYQGSKECFKKYLLVGWAGVFPKECHNLKIMIPIRETLGRFYPKLKSIKFISVLWGWPHKFIQLAQKHGTKVYASQVDSIEEYEEMRKLPLSGIMTNKIELIAPIFK